MAPRVWTAPSALLKEDIRIGLRDICEIGPDLLEWAGGEAQIRLLIASRRERPHSSSVIQADRGGDTDSVSLLRHLLSEFFQLARLHSHR